MSFTPHEVQPMSPLTQYNSYQVHVTVTSRRLYIVEAQSEAEAEQIAEEYLVDGHEGLELARAVEFEETRALPHPHDDGTGFYS